MNTTRILCIGSPYGADRLGWEAGRRLGEMIAPGSAEVEFLDRPGMALIARMRGAARVILLDALRGSQPGVPFRLSGEQVARALACHDSTHGFGIAEALALAAKLGELSDVELIGLCCATDEPSVDEIEVLCAAVLDATFSSQSLRTCTRPSCEP